METIALIVVAFLFGAMIGFMLCMIIIGIKDEIKTSNNIFSKISRGETLTKEEFSELQSMMYN